MEKALSLKTNRIIFALDVDYELSKHLTPVCPECKEPVHLRKRFLTTGTSYFAHNALKDVGGKLCSLRVLGYWDESYKNSGMWTSRGQLTEKIQIDLVSFFSDQFGDEKEKVIKSIRRFIGDYCEFEWIYTDFLDHLDEADHIYKKIREETVLGNDQGREIVSHYNLAITCLKGAKLHLAAQGLLWCSFIVAHSLSDLYKDDPDPPVGAILKGQNFDFCIDSQKYRSLIAGAVSYPTKRDYIYYRCVSIGQRLLIRLLASWRYPESLRHEFISIGSKPELITSSRNEISTRRLEPTPLFRTLAERNRWLSDQKE
jgi:hypothetical protein